MNDEERKEEEEEEEKSTEGRAVAMRSDAWERESREGCGGSARELKMSSDHEPRPARRQ